MTNYCYETEILEYEMGCLERKIKKTNREYSFFKDEKIDKLKREQDCLEYDLNEMRRKCIEQIKKDDKYFSKK